MKDATLSLFGSCLGVRQKVYTTTRVERAKREHANGALSEGKEALINHQVLEDQDGVGWIGLGHKGCVVRVRVCM